MAQAPVIYQKNMNVTSGSYNSNSSASTSEIKLWIMIIALPIVGMLLLLLCFLLQGIFAAVGPWLILLGVTLINKKIRNIYGLPMHD
jgi:hypothetical protein